MTISQRRRSSNSKEDDEEEFDAPLTQEQIAAHGLRFKKHATNHLTDRDLRAQAHRMVPYFNCDMLRQQLVIEQFAADKHNQRQRETGGSMSSVRGLVRTIITARACPLHRRRGRRKSRSSLLLRTTTRRRKRSCGTMRIRLGKDARHLELGCGAATLLLHHARESGRACSACGRRTNSRTGFRHRLRKSRR